jgi:integrase
VTIRKRRYASGKVGWQLNYLLASGKRVQQAFKTRDDAEAERDRVRAELRSGGESMLMISAAERAAIMAARESLAKVGATLNEAVDFYLQHAKPGAGLLRLSELVERCLEAKYEEGKSGRYLGQLKCSAMALVRHLPSEQMAHDVSSDQVKAWLQANQWAPKTWNVYLGDVRTIFEWGKSRGHVTLNPCDAVGRKRLVDDEVAYLSVEQCRLLLDRAAAVRPGAARRDAGGAWCAVDLADEDYRDCLAYVVLGLFCGPRPERELGRKEWADVKLADKMIVVTAGRAKTRARRVIDLPDNAIEWLKLCPQTEGRIVPKNFAKKWKRLRQACGLFDEWPHDALRHTFATMHLAHHQDEKSLQLLMGHVSAQMIYQHYRGLTTRSEAESFWSLLPPG